MPEMPSPEALTAMQFPATRFTTAEDARAGAQQLFRDLGRLVGPNAIDEQRTITLGGHRQWVTLRGQDKSAPILLFLHGGPGSAISDFAYAYQRPWEDFFLVVNWDQRGAGRSAGTIEDAATLTATLSRERYVADAIELIELLRKEFRRERVIVVGQSWGTVLALEIAHRRPDLAHLIVLQGLAIEWLASAEKVRLALIEAAEERGDTAEAQRLRDVGPVPPASDPDAVMAWVPAFGVPIPDRHTWHNIAGEGDGWLRRVDYLRYFSPDLPTDVYAEQVRLAAAHGDAAYQRHVACMKAAMTWNAPHDVGTRFDVPILVMQGVHDWQTDTALARAYFDTIDAPWKHWVDLPFAAHALNIEQPGLSVVTLANIALPAARGEIPPGVEMRTA